MDVDQSLAVASDLFKLDDAIPVSTASSACFRCRDSKAPSAYWCKAPLSCGRLEATKRLLPIFVSMRMIK